MNKQINQSRASSHISKKLNQTRNNQSFRLDNIQIQHRIRSLQDQIEFTICNYESILQTQKKNTAERNEFLLYLIQSMKQKQNQELQKYEGQLQSKIEQKQQASGLESQMKSIGDGVDSIVQEGKKLKQANRQLQKQLQEQYQRQKQIDQQIQSHTKQIEYLRDKVQEWEIKKLKWNRKKKDMVQMIQETQKSARKHSKTCLSTGIKYENCEHCENNNMKKLMNKDQSNGNDR